MRLAFIWLLFAALFVTGPAPWGKQQFKPAVPTAASASHVSQIRSRAEASLDAGQPSDAAALLSGMVLGDGSHLSKRVKDEFKTASLTHVVAASGQNISLMLALALPLLGALGLSLRQRLGVGVVLVLAYVPLAGGEPPIRRAAVMALVLVAAQLRGHRADGWHALGVAGIATLALDRQSSVSLGWQLSFAAVAGMLSLGHRIAALCERRGSPPVVAEALAMTLAATSATTPLIAWRVGKLSLVAIPANLLAGPAVAPAMWLGMLAAAVGQVSAALAAPFAWLASLPAAAVLEVAHVAASPSWASQSWRPTGLMALLALAFVVASGVIRIPARDAA